MAAPFTKTRSRRAADAFFATEAAGLNWLSVAGGPPVPRVHDVAVDRICLDRVVQGPAGPAMAHEFGRRLARLHAAGAPAFGSPPPAAPGTHGWIGDLPMGYAQRDGFAQFWAHDRIAATARMARDRGGLDPRQIGEVEQAVADLLAGQIDTGPPEPPARLHGDLWSGNVLWGADGQVWLIDPAAHGGHRESDLAMLALFGAPHLHAVLDGYQESHALAPGWQERVPLHQAWPLLVHAALFGGSYGTSAVEALRRARG
ncbi:MAG: fructosamine kinase family protein [Candidatus Nanopelagicales bacterium]